MFADAAAYLANSGYWIALFIGMGLAALSGLVPGLGSPVVMAMALPFVVFTVNDPVIGLVLLATITGCNNTLDSLPAITLGIPGASTQVTYLEGHQLARRGQAAHTLGAVYAVSAIGGLVGALCLLAAIPVIRPFILAFSFAEIAAVALTGLAFIGVLSHGARLKGLTGALLGLLLGSIGVAPGTGVERFVFGELFLWQGLPMVAFVIGVLALPELIDLLLSRRPVAAAGADVSFAEVWKGFKYGLASWRVAIRQSALGAALGAVPGLGAPVIEWMSYAFGILFSKDKQQFGKGSLDGVLFTEGAQNAKEGGQAIPTLALGIPGGTAWAIVITAMLAYQVSPGPQMLSQYAHITIVLVITLALSNLGLTLLGVGMTPMLGRLTLIPYPAIAAIAIPLVVVAACLSEAEWLTLIIAALFTVVGLAMKHFGWPRPPLIIGFILGPIIEENLMNAVSLEGSFLGVFARPMTFFLVILFVVLVVLFQWLLAQSVRQAAAITDIQPGHEPPQAVEPARPSLGSRLRPAQIVTMLRGFRFTPQQVPALAALALGVFFLWDGRNLPAAAQIFPASISAGLLVFAVLEFVRAGVSEAKRAQIFDLGMVSAGTTGAFGAALRLLGLFVLSAVVAALFGVPYAAVVFAVLCPLLLMPERYRLFVAVLAGILVGIFVFYIVGEVMGIVFPDPLL